MQDHIEVAEEEAHKHNKKCIGIHAHNDAPVDASEGHGTPTPSDDDDSEDLDAMLNR